MRKIDDKNVSQEEKRQLMAFQGPFVPSKFLFAIEIDWEEGKVYLNNSFEYSKTKWNTHEYLEPRYLNKTSIPIKYKVISVDSVFFPPLLFELKNVEKLSLSGKDITEIPLHIGQLNNLESLRIALYTDPIVEIPSAIKELKRLRKLTIYARTSVKLPWSQSSPSYLEITLKEKLRLTDFEHEYWW